MEDKRIVGKFDARIVPRNNDEKNIRTNTNIDELLQNGVVTSYGGVWLLIPFIQLLGLLKIVSQVGPELSNELPTRSFYLALLGLKAIGLERIGQANDYQDDLGLALFSGLSKIPEQSTIHKTLHKFDQPRVEKFTTKLGKVLAKLGLLIGERIAADFHIIETWSKPARKKKKKYVPRKKKARYAVETLVAQDLDTSTAFFAQSNFEGLKPTKALLLVVKRCEKIFGKGKSKFIIDSKVTIYRTLDNLNKMNVTFITLRRRGKKLKAEVWAMPEEVWNRIHLASPRRKYRDIRIWDSKTSLDDYDGEIRQIVMIDHGRKDPTFIVTNDLRTSAKKIVEEYTSRARIENKLQEMIRAFFYDALPSIMDVKIDANFAFVLLVSCLFQMLAQEIPGYERAKAMTIQRTFINKKATIKAEGKYVVVEFEYFKEQNKIKYLFENIDKIMKTQGVSLRIPWLGYRELKFRFKDPTLL